MKELINLYGEYLKNIGVLDEEIRLGGFDSKGIKDKETIRQQSMFMAGRLNKRLKLNNRIIVIAVSLLCLLFAIGVILIFYYRDFPSIMGSIFGGTFLSLLSIVSWLLKLWREKNFMDITISILEGLPPKKAAEFISIIYWKKLSSSKK